MLAIYITETLQQIVASLDSVLLYYFCSGRDRSRNTAMATMRGIIHQWLTFQPQLAQHIKNHFEGSETTKHAVSNLIHCGDYSSFSCSRVHPARFYVFLIAWMSAKVAL